MASLSICILFRRDVPALQACVDSVRDQGCEVVVIDTGESGERPVVEGGVPVVRPPWDGDEGRLRQRAATVVRGSHILYLDATERLAAGAIDVVLEHLTEDPVGLRIPVVEADSTSPNCGTVVEGAGRLGEPALELRVLSRAACRTWRGVRQPRADVDDGGIYMAPAWVVSTALIRGTGDPGTLDEAWIRASVASPGDPVVLAGAARRMVDRGRVDDAQDLADRALALACPGEGLLEATVVSALCALHRGRPQAAVALLDAARYEGLDHPDLDLLTGLAGLELDTADSLEMAERHLRASLEKDGQHFEIRPLPGATSSAARVGLATTALAAGRIDVAAEAVEAMVPATRRSVPGRLLGAEAALDAGEPEAALRLLVDRLEHCGADGWILAAESAAAVGRTGDALAFVDRAEERVGEGLVAPHRARRLRRVRAELAAGAVRDRLAGGAKPLPDVADPRLKGEQMAQQGEPEAAHALLIEALRRAPADVVAWTDLGVVFHEAGAADPAALALRMAVELEPERADLRAQLAAVSWTGGHLTDAAVQAREALSREELPDARALLAAMDVEGESRATVAVISPTGAASSWVPLVRLARCRPALPHPDLLQALSVEPRAARLAWLDAAAPGLVLLDDHPDAEGWVEACARQGRVVRWIGQGPAPRGIEACPDDLLAVLASASRRRPVARPQMSVVIHFRQDRAAVEALLDRLALQDLPPSMMEVVLVDSGLGPPLRRMDLGDRPWPLRVVRTAIPGSAAARNAGIDQARGKIVWFLDDDARPALDAARGHLVGQLTADGPTALVGEMRLLERHRLTVWDHLLDTSDLGRGRPTLPLGASLPWRAFGISNTSIPRGCLQGVGGFEVGTFPDDTFEGIELGYRLSERGVALVARGDLHCGRDRREPVRSWADRAEALGRAHVALHRLHGEAVATLDLTDQNRPRGMVLDALRSMVELGAARVDQAQRALRRLGATKLPADPEQRRALVERARRLAEVVGNAAHQRGLVAACSMLHDPTPLALAPTTVIVAHDPAQDGADAGLELMIEGLRRHTAGPVEVVIAHRGAAGPRLSSWSDVVRVEQPAAATPAELWAAGLTRATGETLFFCDDHALFTPDWRPGLIRHLEAWPDIGMVSALGARARSDLDRVAPQFATERAGQHAWPARPPLARTMVRRALLRTVGGPDPHMGALAGLDWSLRARIAGFRVRLAGDVLIGATADRQAPTTADLRTFRARYRTIAMTRNQVRAIADETAFDARVHVVPAGVGLEHDPVLLHPVSESTLLPQPDVNREEQADAATIGPVLPSDLLIEEVWAVAS